MSPLIFIISIHSICKVFSPSSVFVFSCALAKSESQHWNTVITRSIVTAGKYVCCFGLLCWILMSYQTLQEKSFLLFLSGWFALLENRKWESLAAKRPFSGPSWGWVITEDIAAVTPWHNDRYISSWLMLLQRTHSNPIKHINKTLIF